MKRLKKFLAEREAALASWWKSSLPRVPISYLHHVRHRAYLDGRRMSEVCKEAWHETLATRQSRLKERMRKKEVLEKEGVHA
jgi:hypothetical protein